MEIDRNILVIEMIGAAVLAGAYRALIRQDRALTAGFGKLADKHSARAATLANEISRAAPRGWAPDAAIFAATGGRSRARNGEERNPGS